jgi:hypothetical protein
MLNSGKGESSMSDKVKTTVYFTPATWDRLLKYLVAKYGRNVNATSITIEQAVILFLDTENAPPAD